MALLKDISSRDLAIIVGMATTISWIVLPWKLAMVITLIGGGLVALRKKEGEPATD